MCLQIYAKVKHEIFSDLQYLQNTSSFDTRQDLQNLCHFYWKICQIQATKYSTTVS